MLAETAEGGVAAGDESLDEGGRDGEGGRALAGVEDAEAAAGAGADVEEAAAAAKRAAMASTGVRRCGGARRGRRRRRWRLPR